jgi:hypothetical protein
MANPVINNLSAVMTSFNSGPVVDLEFNLQHTDGLDCDVATNGFQYAMATDLNTWFDCTAHASLPTTDFQSFVSSPGRLTELRWSVKTDLASNDEQVKIRVKVTDTSAGDSAYVETTLLSIKTTDPTASFTLSDYTNTTSVSFSVSSANAPSHYRTAEADDFASVSWIAFSGTAQHTFDNNTEETKSIYLELRDQYFNVSTSESDSILYHITPPEELVVRINGTVPGIYDYTGVTLTDDYPTSRAVSLDVFATDLLDIEIYIDGPVEDSADVRAWIDLKTPIALELTGSDENYDADATITVQFRDAAQNTSSVNKTTRLNTKVFQASNQLLREISTDYSPQVLKVTSSGNTTVVAKTKIVSDQFVRGWSEIFYPTTHDYPRGSDGLIDEAVAISMNNASNATYGAVQITDGEVVYDSQDRPVSVDWVTDGTKTYLSLESSSSANLKYWTVDNTAYGNIDLEFEYFHIDANSFGPPYNNLSPYVGDCLVVYDASDPAALNESASSSGEITYTINDSSALVELYAYTGEGTRVVNLTTGFSANADSNGSFSVPTITTTKKIVLMLYSDASSEKSGFKLKGSDKHSKNFNNWDIDASNGLLWLHEYPTGASHGNDVRMVYDYNDTDISIDHDAGEVTFAADPSGVVSADYTFFIDNQYKLADDYSRLFILSNDDLVDYEDLFLYTAPSGVISKIEIYEHGYPTPITPSGKVTQNFTIDKDRGTIEFKDGTVDHADPLAYVPSGKMVCDYNHHSYLRLSNDGYGTLTFRDETLVADDTPLFPDYTWSDVKLVNEGDAILEDGKLKFLARGYDTDGDSVIDQVLDVNRPWDIQNGSAPETYDKVAMEASESYSFPSSITRTEAASILANWKDQVFGFDVYPRTSMYGRIAYILGGTSETGYPSTTVGEKVFSCELEGRYYSVSV